MTYEIFKKTLKEYLINKLGEDYIVESHSHTKNNDITLDILSVRRNGSTTGRTIDLNGMYKLAASKKYSVPDLAAWIARECAAKAPFTREDFSWLENFNSAKNKVCCKLVNTAANTKLLQQIPSVPYLDLSVIFYVDIRPERDMGDSTYTTKITNEIIHAWGVTAEELYPIALANTQRLNPGIFCSLETVMTRMAQAKKGKMSEEDKAILHKNFMSCPMYILSCLDDTGGAIAALYPGIMKTAADKIGCDLIVIPSSIHELILLKDDNTSDRTFVNYMIQNINRSAVQPEAVLADHAYLYSRETDQLRIMTLEDSFSSKH